MPVKVENMEISSDQEHNIGDDSHHDDSVDDSSSDDDIYYSGASESESDDDHEPIVATRGPSNQGTERFERYIVYGNYVVLSDRRWNFLKKIVSEIKPDIPFYVSEITLAIEGKGKMYFSLDYSQNFLKYYLHKERLLRVTNEFYPGSHQVRLAMGKHDGCAIITTN